MRIVRYALVPLLLLTLSAACRRQMPATDARHLYDQALEAIDQDSTQQGEQRLQQAIRLARKQGDWHTLYLAQLELAQSLSWGNTEAALAMAKEALQTYRRHPDSERNLVIILDYIGTYASQRAYNDDAPFDEALRYAQRAHRRAVAIKDTTLTSQTLTTLANIHWGMAHYAEARRLARQAVRLAPPALLLGAQQVLARCLVSCDSLDEAEEVYRSMDYGRDIQAAYIVQSNLAKLALRRDSRKEAEEAIDAAFSHAERLYFEALQQKADYYQTCLQQERENERLRYRHRMQRTLLGGGMLLLVVLTVAVVREVRLRHRQTVLYRLKSEAQQEQLRQREATVDFLKDFILQRSDVLQKLSDKGNRHIALSDHEWQEVERTLNAIDGGLFRRIRTLHPELKEDDLHLCILTRLRLSNRTIGNVYGISISAVQHRKLKLKKEVFGQADPETTLEQVLDKI